MGAGLAIAAIGGGAGLLYLATQEQATGVKPGTNLVPVVTPTVGGGGQVEGTQTAAYKGFTAAYIDELKAVRRSYGPDPTVPNGTIPFTPVQTAVALQRVWLDRLPTIVKIALAPAEETVTEIGWADIAGVGWVGGVSQKLLVDNVSAAAAGGHVGTLYDLLPTIYKYQEGYQDPLGKFRALLQVVAQGMQNWVMAPRNVVAGGQAFSPLLGNDAQRFWEQLARVAIAADANATKVVSLDRKIDTFIETAKNQGKVVAETVAEKAADAVDYGADLAGRAAFSFASASGLLAVLVIGGGVYYLTHTGGSTAAAGA